MTGHGNTFKNCWLVLPDGSRIKIPDSIESDGALEQPHDKIEGRLPLGGEKLEILDGPRGGTVEAPGAGVKDTTFEVGAVACAVDDRGIPKGAAEIAVPVNDHGIAVENAISEFHNSTPADLGSRSVADVPAVTSGGDGGPICARTHSTPARRAAA